MRDLTERRRYELAQGQEARFRSLVQNAAVGHHAGVARGASIESVSGAITRLLGHDPELLEHRPSSSIVADATASTSPPPSSWPAGATLGPPGDRGSGSGATTAPGPCPSSSASSTWSTTPRSGASSISAHDATAQVRPSGSRGLLSLLTATLDSTADGILVVDMDGKITSFNRRFIETWRIPEDSCWPATTPP